MARPARSLAVSVVIGATARTIGTSAVSGRIPARVTAAVSAGIPARATAAGVPPFWPLAARACRTRASSQIAGFAATTATRTRLGSSHNQRFVLNDDGSIVDLDRPLTKPVELADRILPRNESSYVASSSAGSDRHTRSTLLRTDACEFASNDPCEDAHFVVRIGNIGTLFGVTDGHAGSQCAKYIAAHFPAFFERMVLPILASEPPQSTGDSPSPTPNTKLIQTIQDTFVAFDRSILDLPLLALPSIDTMSTWDMDRLSVKEGRRIIEIIAPALSGACLTTALIFDSGQVIISNTGDCSILIGHRRGNNTWSCTQPHALHIADDPSEHEYLKTTHPGEEATVVFRPPWSQSARVLGTLEPTRAFGNGFYKWPLDMQRKISRIVSKFPSVSRVAGVLPGCKTPPYVHVKPSVHTWNLTSEDHFIILSSDGIFEHIDNNTAADIVGDYMDHVAGPVLNVSKYPIRHVNAATHLIRQALRGGSSRLNGATDVDFTTLKPVSANTSHRHHSQTHNTTSTPIPKIDVTSLNGDRGDHDAKDLIEASDYPSSRHARDDLTVMVAMLKPSEFVMYRTQPYIANKRTISQPDSS